MVQNSHSPIRRRQRHLWFAALTASLTVLLASGALPQSTAPRTTLPPPADKVSAMDEPLRLLAEARKAFQDVRDYTCVLIKKERLRGVMQPDNVVSMKVRNRPFSIYLRWQQPKDLGNQEACYVAGKNDGKMRVHSTGIPGLVGWVSLDPTDERAKKNSNHTITEAGIGNLLNRYAKAWEAEKVLNLTRVKIGEYEFNKRRCVRVETQHPEKPDARFVSYRSVIYFDKETHLPVRAEIYDWPRQGGAAEGELLEVYSYVNLKLNVQLGDDAFNY
jgi:uncharacterized protein DUF1571